MKKFAPKHKVQRQIKNEGSLQPKLEVGKPNDPYEREADQMANKVMRMPTDNTLSMSVIDEDKGSMKPSNLSSGIMQMKVNNSGLKHMSSGQSQIHKSDDEIQTKSDDLIQRSADGKLYAEPNVTSQIQRKKGTGTKMSAKVNQEMSSKMGSDFSNVNIHNDTESAALNKQLGAKAFANGNDVFFNKDQYNPNSREGKHLLAHELTHVMQQSAQIRRDPERKSFNSALLQDSPELVEVLNGERVLRLGHRGTHIEILQQGLMQAGIELTGGATGTYDENTKNAVIQFQENRMILGKYQDGVVGAVTISLLDKRISNKSFDAIAVLEFDGSTLKWLVDGVAVFSFSAVSGLKSNNGQIAKLIAEGRDDLSEGIDYTTSEYQDLAGVGPIPEGDYSLNLVEGMPYQKSGGGWGIGGWKLSDYYSASQFFNDLDDYFGTNIWRNGFYLHEDGGNNGTAGCIGLENGNDVAILQNVLTAYQENHSFIKVKVTYE